MTQEPKVTQQLTSALDRSAEDELIDVVVELVAPEPLAMMSSRSRAEEIQVRRDAFERESASVEALVRHLGGEVRSRAWINQTLRAVVPKDAVVRISALNEVALLDLPLPLEAESES